MCDRVRTYPRRPVAQPARRERPDDRWRRQQDTRILVRQGNAEIKIDASSVARCTVNPPQQKRVSESVKEAFERFSGLSNESEALEIGSHMLKAFFDPTTHLPQADCAKEGFADRLIDYIRSQ